MLHVIYEKNYFGVYEDVRKQIFMISLFYGIGLMCFQEMLISKKKYVNLKNFFVYAFFLMLSH